ncbi:MAG: XdhC family protein, partial [Xanthomonadales bacterium]|nr:XdhC family protein [Xanthomonadales bacterium]
MDERLFARLAGWLEQQAVVLASVVEARGATPRRPGSRMLVTAASSLGSIGGGLAEVRVLEAARRLLGSS